MYNEVGFMLTFAGPSASTAEPAPVDIGSSLFGQPLFGGADFGEGAPPAGTGTLPFVRRMKRWRR